MNVRGARGSRGVWSASLAMLVLAGCAPVAPQSSAPSPAPAPATSTPSSPTPPRHTPAPSSAVVDSGPSADAERVLATIPEPLGGPPQPIRRAVPAPEVASDTLRASQPAEDDSPVPVPAPTQPMRPTPIPVAAPDTTRQAPPVSTPPPSAAPSTPSAPSTTSAPANPPASAPSTPPPPVTPPPANGDCWRLQVAAPAEREKAHSRHDAAESLLLVPMVIERESGLYKVRSRDCMTREAADALRRRALDSGFDGSFVIRSKLPQ